MAAIFARWIKAGHLAIEDVPEHWREAVSARLEGEEA